MSLPPRLCVVVRGSDPACLEPLRPHASGAKLVADADPDGALRRVSAEVVIFVRPECRPLAGWLERFRRAFAEDPALAAAAGRVFPALSPDASDWARVVARENLGPFERFDLGHFDRVMRPLDRGFLPADNVAVRRAAALETGGLAPGLSLVQGLAAAGRRVIYLPGATVRRRIEASFPLDERFAAWWRDYGRMLARGTEAPRGWRRWLARWQAARKSRSYLARMAAWPERGEAWTTLAAKHHLHAGRALELASPPRATQ